MKKILIAEDNDSNYVLMTYLLKKDFEFERAKNGQIAVEMVDANAYDLVLMDIKMPYSCRTGWVLRLPLKAR